MTPAELAAFDEPLRSVTWALLTAFAASLLLVVAEASQALWKGPEGSAHWSSDGRRVVLFCLISGLFVRLAAPTGLVMHYMGYELIEQARLLGVTPKYGPASFQLQHAVLQIGDGTHLSVIAGHQLLASLLPILAAAWVLRLGCSGRAVAWTSGLVALTPLLVRDAGTESLLVESALWALGAAWLCADYVRSGAPHRAVLAAVWGLLAMLARPEMLATVPLLLAATVWLCRAPPRRPHNWAVVGLLVGCCLMVVWWRVQQMNAALTIEQARGNTPRVFQQGHVALAGQLLRDALWDKNALLWPRFFPAATTFAIGSGLVLATGPARKRLTVLAVLTVAWLLPTALDLPFVSVPRVQAPALLLASVTGGVALAIVHGSLHAMWAASQSRVVGVLLAGVWLVTAAITVPALWRAGPAQAEEQAIQRAAKMLPAAKATVVARGHDDQPDERIHLAMPRRSWGPNKRAERIGELLNGALRAAPQTPIYAWLGTRCFMRPCTESAVHPACAKLREQFTLEPVMTQQVEVAQVPIPDTFGRQLAKHPGAVADLDFPWCFTQRSMEIGLYRVVGRKKGGSS